MKDIALIIVLAIQFYLIVRIHWLSKLAVRTHQRIKLMDADIKAIIDQATANTSAELAAAAALASLFGKLMEAINKAPSLSDEDRAALQAKVAEMESSRQALAAAIVANTPSEPAPEPVVEPVEPV